MFVIGIWVSGVVNEAESCDLLSFVIQGSIINVGGGVVEIINIIVFVIYSITTILLVYIQ